MATTCVERPQLCCMVRTAGEARGGVQAVVPPGFWNSWFWLDPWLAGLVEGPVYSFRRP
jgi:hypothetical protein